MKSRIPLVERQYLLPFILITSLFFAWGFARAILDVLNKHFQDVLEISKTQSSLIQVAIYMAYFMMAIPSGLFMERYDRRRGVILGLVLFGLASLLFIPGDNYQSFPVFLTALFIMGCGLTFLETAANPYVTEMGARETAASRLNLSQSFNGLGAMLAPVITGAFIFSDADGAGGSIAVPYTAMGVVVLLIAIVFTRVKLPEITYEQTTVSDAQSKPLTRQPLFLFGLIALLAYEISEISINTFFINYAVEDGLMSKQDATYLLSFGGLMLFMIGRFVGSAIMRYVPAERLLFICAIGTVITTTVVMANLGTVSFVALCLGYAFEAIMFPTIFSLALRGLGAQTKRASSLLMMTPVGGVIGPPLMGFIAEQTHIATAFIVPLIGYAVVLAYSWRVLKRV